MPPQRTGRRMPYQVGRRALYLVTLHPFGELPELSLAERAVERFRAAGNTDGLERWLCRLDRTLREASTAEVLGKRPGSPELPILNQLVRDERARLDADYARAPVDGGLATVARALRELYPDGADSTDEQLRASAPFAWEKDPFIFWAGERAGWSKSTARRRLEAAGCLVKGKKGVPAAGLPETIRLVLETFRA